jgi:TPP-dependent indolepyruvate ferredoxin oxidoreductase alpha subunit
VVINEKVALEYGLGDSLSEKRSVIIIKNVGLNVCADPLVNATTQGLRSGVVIVLKWMVARPSQKSTLSCRDLALNVGFIT